MAQPTYEELVKDVSGMKTLLADYKTKLDTFSATDDSKDKDLEASFLKAQDEMDTKDKEHSATEDENNKVKDAFKKAQDETDPEKKKEAMKKAMEMKDEHEKTAKNYKSKSGQDEDKDDEHDAKVAAVVMKKIPLMQKILSATRIIDPANADKLEKYLTAATLEQVEEKWKSIQPFVAAAGLEQKSASIGQTPGFIPFQAAQVTGDNPTDIFSASVDDIDFDKVPTSKIMEMYK